MTNSIIALWQQDDGAVTIDWVVLTDALVGLSISVVAVFASASKSPEGNYNTNLSSAQSFVDDLDQ